MMILLQGMLLAQGYVLACESHGGDGDEGVVFGPTWFSIGADEWHREYAV